MPRLPDRSDLQAPNSFASKRPDFNGGDIASGAQVAQSAGNFGGQLQGIAEDEAAQNNALDVIKADTAHKSGLLDTERQFQNDPDYKTYDQRFGQQTSAITTDAAQLIQNPQLREKWQAKAALDNESARNKVLTWGQKRDQDTKQADLIDALTKQKAIYTDPQADDQRRAQALADTNAYIDLGVKTGLIDNGYARKLKEDYVRGSVLQDAETQLSTNPNGLKTDLAASSNSADARKGVTVTPKDRDIMIRTMIGEAGSEGDKGMAAVANVILNRAKAGNFGGTSPSDVSLAKGQFEPWMTRSAELQGISQDSPEYKAAAKVLDNVLAGNSDETGGATHFLSKPVMADRGANLPAWANQFPQTAQIGTHSFYKQPGAKTDGEVTQGDEPVPQGRYGLLTPLERYDLASKANGVDVRNRLDSGEDIDKIIADVADAKNGPYSNMKRDDRSKLLNVLHVANRANTQQAINDDLERIRQTGEPERDANGMTSLDRAARSQSLTKNEFVKAQQGWAKAQMEAKAILPLDEMTADQADAHLNSLSADKKLPADSYKMVSDVEKKARTAWDNIVSNREKDPADAVDNSPEVEKVRDAFSAPVQQLDGSMRRVPPPDPVQAQQQLMDARIAAQQRLGIPDTSQSPITRQEAQKLLNMGDPSKLDIAKFYDKLKEAADRAEQQFGTKYAGPALKSAVGFLVKKEDEKQFAAPIIADLITKGSVNPDDVKKLGQARAVSPLSNFVNALNVPARPDTSLPTPAAGATLPLPKPNKDQIDFIRENPDAWKEFDKRFGAGAAARTLGAAPNGKLPPPDGPGVFGQIRNLISGAPTSPPFTASDPDKYAAQPAPQQ